MIAVDRCTQGVGGVRGYYIGPPAHRQIFEKPADKNAIQQKMMYHIELKEHGPPMGFGKNLIYPPPPDFRPCSSMRYSVSIELTLYAKRLKV
jgi:hypothetical protein